MTYYCDDVKDAFGWAEWAGALGVPTKVFKQSGRWWVTVQS